MYLMVADFMCVCVCVCVCVCIGMQVLEWNSISLTGKTYEEVQGLVSHQVGEAEICVRLWVPD